MGSLATALLVLGCAFGAALVGTWLRPRLPAPHLHDDSRDVLKLVMGLVATMAALVLGLLVASANASHDREAQELREVSADIALLDRTLALYGPDARNARSGLRDLVRQTHDAVWSSEGVRPENLNSATVQSGAMATLEQVTALEANTDAQRLLKPRAVDQADSVTRARLQMFESQGGQIAWPFLTVLIFWISILFLGFGLLAPSNLTVVMTQFLGAVSVAGAVFLILELNEPFSGLLRVSDAPLNAVIAQLNRP